MVYMYPKSPASSTTPESKIQPPSDLTINASPAPAKTLVLTVHPRPHDPNRHNPNLQRCRQPQRPRHAQTTMSKQPADQRTNQQHQRSAHSPIPLDIIQTEQLSIAKQIAVNTGEHNTRQRIVFQRATRHGLSTRLERHQRDGQQNVPRDGVGGLRRAARAESDDGGGGGAEDGLESERGEQSGATRGCEGAVEACEGEGADAEGDE